jgi:hypothetical protein
VMKGDGNYDNQKLVQFIELFCICWWKESQWQTLKV